MPSAAHGAANSAAQFYLPAVKTANTDDGEKVNDMNATGGDVRADRRMVHDMFLMRVKTPESSTTPWDDYDLVNATQAESRCSLWK